MTALSLKNPLAAVDDQGVRHLVRMFLLALLSVPQKAPKPGKEPKDPNVTLTLRAEGQGFRSDLRLGAKHVAWLLYLLEEGPSLLKRTEESEADARGRRQENTIYREALDKNEAIVQGFQKRLDEADKRLAEEKAKALHERLARAKDDERLASVLESIADVVSDGKGKLKSGVPDLRKAEAAILSVAGQMRCEQVASSLWDVYPLRPFLPPEENPGPDHGGDPSALSSEDT